MYNKRTKAFLTYFAVIPSETRRASTCIWTNAIRASSTVIARITSAFIDIWKYNKIWLLQGSLFWFWILNKTECYVLVLQSEPVNPWAQLQVKESIPSTQTPPFKQGLVSQSSMSKKIEYLLENLNNYQIFSINSYYFHLIFLQDSPIFETYWFHNPFLWIQWGKHRYTKQLHQHMFLHCYMDHPYSHQYLEDI